MDRQPFARPEHTADGDRVPPHPTGTPRVRSLPGLPLRRRSGHLHPRGLARGPRRGAAELADPELRRDDLRRLDVRRGRPDLHVGAHPEPRPGVHGLGPRGEHLVRAPGRGTLSAEFNLPESETDDLRTSLSPGDSTTREYEVELVDEDGETVPSSRRPSTSARTVPKGSSGGSVPGRDSERLFPGPSVAGV
jgi:hypothetical protein